MAGTNSDSDVRWTAAQQPGLADQPLHMWGAQDSKMSAKHWSRRKALSQWKYLFVSIENANGCKCIPLSTWYMLTDHNDVSACTSCTWIMIDQILELELHIPARYRLKTSQDVSRNLSCLWEPNRNVDQRWFRFTWLLLETDRFLAAAVLCRRLRVFGCLTLEMSPRSPDVLPDPFLPDDVSQGSFLSMHLTCQCTIATDGVFQSLSKISHDTKTETNEIDSRQICSEVACACAVAFQSIHEKCSHGTVLKPRSFLQRFRIRGSNSLLPHSKLSLLVRTSHTLVLRHSRD